MEGTERFCINKSGFWKVLIVDDDNFIHRMLKEINKDLTFEDKGIEFYSAYTSQKAVNILKANKDIALVLLDVFLEEKRLRSRLSKIH